MPTILRIGPYRFFFYSADGVEPIHVHVERDNSAAKIWLKPVRLDSSDGFNRSDLRNILSIVEEHSVEIERKWHDYFN